MGDMWILLTVIRRAAVRLLRHLRRGIFLVPVAAMAIALFGLHLWTVAVVLLAVTVAFWRPVVPGSVVWWWRPPSPGRASGRFPSSARSSGAWPGVPRPS